MERWSFRNLCLPLFIPLSISLRQALSLLVVPNVYTTQNMFLVERFDWHTRIFSSQNNIERTVGNMEGTIAHGWF